MNSGQFQHCEGDESGKTEEEEVIGVGLVVDAARGKQAVGAQHDGTIILRILLRT